MKVAFIVWGIGVFATFLILCATDPYVVEERYFLPMVMIWPLFWTFVFVSVISIIVYAEMKEWKTNHRSKKDNKNVDIKEE